MRTGRLLIRIRGLSATGGTATAERVLAQVPGVTDVYVNPRTEIALIEYDAAACYLAKLTHALERAGLSPIAPWARASAAD